MCVLFKPTKKKKKLKTGRRRTGRGRKKKGKSEKKKTEKNGAFKSRFNESRILLMDLKRLRSRKNTNILRFLSFIFHQLVPKPGVLPTRRGFNCFRYIIRQSTATFHYLFKNTRFVRTKEQYGPGPRRSSEFIALPRNLQSSLKQQCGRSVRRTKIIRITRKKLLIDQSYDFPSFGFNAIYRFIYIILYGNGRNANRTDFARRRTRTSGKQLIFRKYN